MATHVSVREVASGHTVIDAAGDRWAVRRTECLSDGYSSRVIFEGGASARYLWDDVVSVECNGRPPASDR